MNEEEVDRRLARMRGAAEAATANLIELEDLGTLSLLRAGKCTGASTVPVRKALDDINLLNLHYAAFMRFVNEIENVRSDGRFTRDKARVIERMLNTRSIELPAREIELASRELFTPTEQEQRVTPDEVVRLMNEEFVSAKAIVFQVDTVWRDLLPALDRARARLGKVSDTADALGERLPELRDLRARIDWCHDAIATDPLGAGTNVAANIEPTLSRLENHVKEVAAARHGLAGQLTVARRELATIVETIDQSDAARREARRAVLHPEGLLKVDRSYLNDERHGLIPWLDRLDDLQADGRWRDAQTGLRRWNERAEHVLTIARDATTANRASLGRRNELRGMLSAYEAIARRDRGGSDAELARLHEAAHRNLFGEPADLGAAAEQVRAYQHAVRRREHS
ncbi:MAG: hypothetical protein HYX32_05240 [Actinobacteria bacterium]|nr:hypothetical protein [Actinomycetota bacterium]